MSTRLEIYFDVGNIINRCIDFCKSEFHNHTVIITNNETCEAYEYNDFHNELENGSYTFSFYDYDGNRENACLELEVTDHSPRTTYALFEYNNFASNFFARFTDAGKISQYWEKKRLRIPTKNQLQL